MTEQTNSGRRRKATFLLTGALVVLLLGGAGAGTGTT